MEKALGLIKKIIPKSVFDFFRPIYHYKLARLGALVYRFPSRKIKVIAVTGTKGKSSVAELLNAVLEEAGFKTALANTIRFKVGGMSQPNLHKMTMPGRFFLQRFLRRAVGAGCTHAIIEMTSEGARQFRHKFIALDGLVFTNLAPEHIESHGSYQKYLAAKVSLAHSLEQSPKKNKTLIVNRDDEAARKFMDAFSGRKLTFSKQDAGDLVVSDEGVAFTWRGVRIFSKLPGEFNLYNLLAAANAAEAFGAVPLQIKAGLEKVTSIRGRAEKITLPRSDIESGKRSDLKTQDFKVIVDYAHTPDSLEKLYQTYAGRFRICVLGNTGGGRDKWKRPIMGGLAEKYCDEIFLTNEDPYDEDPEKITREMAAGIKAKRPHIILDRRAAIREALSRASRGDVVLITGKGTDPCICGPRGSRIPWDDADTAREELQKLRGQQNP